MTIKASDLTWAQFNFADTDEAKAALEAIEADIKGTKRAIELATPFVSKEDLLEHLAELEQMEEELLDVLFQDMFDLL